MRDLLRSVGSPLLAAVRAIVGRNAQDADDIVQEALVALVHALPAFRGECSIVHYASRIAVRTAMAARKRRMSQETRADGWDDIPGTEPYAASPGDESAPVNTVRSRLRLAKEALRRRIERDPSLAEVLGGES
jgi:RNA polymerase sigma-70 factor (ECF subfamily)